MPTQTKSPSKGLFSEPSYSETGVWCILNEEIDPAEWAGLCRYIGSLGSNEFKKIKKTIIPSPDSLKSRLKRMFSLRGSDLRGIPIFSLGPSGLGGEFQRDG